MRIKGVVLENKSDASVFGGEIGNVVIAEEDSARSGFLQSAYHIKSCALAAARRAEKTDELAVRYFKGEIVYRDNLLV